MDYKTLVPKGAATELTCPQGLPSLQREAPEAQLWTRQPLSLQSYNLSTSVDWDAVYLELGHQLCLMELSGHRRAGSGTAGSYSLGICIANIFPLFR